MKRCFALILAITLVFSLIPSMALSLSVPVPESYWFDYCVFSNTEDGFLINTEYLESVGCYPSKYGAGCIPLVIESYEELDKVLPYYEPDYSEDDLIPPGGARNPFFFDEHYIVFIYAYSPTPGYKYRVDKVNYYNDTTFIEYTCTEPDGEFPTILGFDLIEITLLRENAPEDIENIKLSVNFEYENSQTPPFEIIELSTENIIIDIDPKNYYGKGATPRLVTSPEELDDLDIAGVDKDTFDYLISDYKLFFDYYDILLFTAYSPAQTVKYDITHTYLTDNGAESIMSVFATYDNSTAFDLATQYTLIAVILEKELSSSVDSFKLYMTPSVRCGDVDGSGNIEVYDYLYAKRHYFGTLILEGEQFARADVNRDGVVDQYDYILIKRIYFGTYIAD